MRVTLDQWLTDVPQAMSGSETTINRLFPHPASAVRADVDKYQVAVFRRVGGGADQRLDRGIIGDRIGFRQRRDGIARD